MKNTLVIVLIITLVSCSTIRKITAPEDKNLLSGSGSLMKDSTMKSFEEIDLKILLEKYDLLSPKKVSKQQNNKEYEYLRNDLQERLISASNQRCSTYIRTVISSKSQAATGWTSLSILLSGAAAVVSHPATVSALAAGSSVSTGILSSYNEAYFNNLTINVIARGIEKKRESILEHIQNKKASTLSIYSVNAAISDAIAYHSACNIISGMEAASKALSVDGLTITKDVRN